MNAQFRSKFIKNVKKHIKLVGTNQYVFLKLTKWENTFVTKKKRSHRNYQKYWKKVQCQSTLTQIASGKTLEIINSVANVKCLCLCFYFSSIYLRNVNKNAFSLRIIYLDIKTYYAGVWHFQFLWGFRSFGRYHFRTWFFF